MAEELTKDCTKQIFAAQMEKLAQERQGTVHGMLLSVMASNGPTFPFPLSECVARTWKDIISNEVSDVIPTFEQKDGQCVKLKDFKFATKDDDEAKALYTAWAIKQMKSRTK